MARQFGPDRRAAPYRRPDAAGGSAMASGLPPAPRNPNEP